MSLKDLLSLPCGLVSSVEECALTTFVVAVAAFLAPFLGQDLGTCHVYRGDVEVQNDMPHGARCDACGWANAGGLRIMRLLLGRNPSITGR